MIQVYSYVPDFVEELIGCKIQVNTKDGIFCGTLISVTDDFLNIDGGEIVHSIDKHTANRFLYEENERFNSEKKEDINPIGMPSERFKALLDELDGNSLQTLKEKNARYSQNGDCLHNFRSGADIAGGTPAQACWGYLTKHLVALRDMVQRDDFSNRDDLLEKCQDTINYVRFLWCIGNDESNDAVNVTTNQDISIDNIKMPNGFYVAHTSSEKKVLDAVLARLIDCWDRKGWVSFADFFQALGINYDELDKNQGWTSLEGSMVTQYDIDGYALLLPDPKEL